MDPQRFGVAPAELPLGGDGVAAGGKSNKKFRIVWTKSSVRGVISAGGGAGGGGHTGAGETRAQPQSASASISQELFHLGFTFDPPILEVLFDRGHGRSVLLRLGGRSGLACELGRGVGTQVPGQLGTRAVALVRGNERSDTQRQREAPRGQRAPAANELQCGEPARTHAAARRARRSFHQP